MHLGASAPVHLGSSARLSRGGLSRLLPRTPNPLAPDGQPVKSRSGGARTSVACGAQRGGGDELFLRGRVAPRARGRVLRATRPQATALLPPFTQDMQRGEPQATPSRGGPSLLSLMACMQRNPRPVRAGPLAPCSWNVYAKEPQTLSKPGPLRPGGPTDSSSRAGPTRGARCSSRVSREQQAPHPGDAHPPRAPRVSGTRAPTPRTP